MTDYSRGAHLGEDFFSHLASNSTRKLTTGSIVSPSVCLFAEFFRIHPQIHFLCSPSRVRGRGLPQSHSEPKVATDVRLQGVSISAEIFWLPLRYGPRFRAARYHDGRPSAKAPIKFGQQVFEPIFDTGSANTRVRAWARGFLHALMLRRVEAHDLRAECPQLQCPVQLGPSSKDMLTARGIDVNGQLAAEGSQSVQHTAGSHGLEVPAASGCCC